MTKDEALKVALNVLRNRCEPDHPVFIVIKAALEAKDEPVAHMNQNGVVRKVGYEWGPNNTLTALYATQPQRTWAGLTKEDMPDGENPMFDHEYFIAGMVFAAKILEEKNT